MAHLLPPTAVVVALTFALFLSLLAVTALPPTSPLPLSPSIPAPAPSTPSKPLSLWHLPFPNISDDAAGYPVLPSLTTLPLFLASNSSPSFGTYSHHPHLLVVNDSSPVLLVSFSNGLTDEDADGQQVLFRVSHDSGRSFSPPLPLFPPALLPGQRPSLWRPNSLQRAMCSEGFLPLPHGRILALAELYGVSNVSLPGETPGWRATGFGRVAREVAPVQPTRLGPLCWLQPSRYAGALEGTPYDLARLPRCGDSGEVVALLSQGGHQPAWSWALMSDNHPVLAGNGSVEEGLDIAEPTHAFPFTSTPGTVCRLWRTLGPPPNRTELIECAQAASSEYNGWFNGTDETGKGSYGPYPTIVPTDIPDVGSKAVLLGLPASAPFTHLYASNPCQRPSGDRFPLTIAASVDNATLTSVHALHAHAPPRARYEGRYKNWGWQYPSMAVQRSAKGWGDDDMLFIAYSLNKEDIYLSSTPIRDLHARAATEAE